jgi:hypothetical protein
VIVVLGFWKAMTTSYIEVFVLSFLFHHWEAFILVEGINKSTMVLECQLADTFLKSEIGHDGEIDWVRYLVED